MPDLFVYVWVYEVAPEKIPEFLDTYGPDGPWCELFRRANGYLGTELLEDRNRSGRFLTIDRWESKEAFGSFRSAFSTEFEELDRRGERITSSEISLGDFGPPRTA